MALPIKVFNELSGRALHPSVTATIPAGFNAAYPTAETRYRSRQHIALCWLAAAISATSILAPPAANAQTCKQNVNGCVASGTPCSPVETGIGPAGKCTTSGPNHDRSCSCDGTPAPLNPPIDPRCADRTAKGQIVCTIDQPVVTQKETVYPMVAFAPGDHVEVAADGCVQTGGHGSTWKRYVNPSGANSDRLYHGLIRIPTATSSALVRINTVIGESLVVSGANVPVSTLVLHLGYEDDGYSDNGYYSHDNGTGNQCKTDPTKSIDGGPAHVTVTINR